jgi:hypothetical protein
MSPTLAAPLGLSTAAETAWFDQEVTAEPTTFDRPNGSRRLLAVFAATFLVIGSVIGVARATVSPPRATPSTAPASLVAPAAAAPVKLAATSKPKAKAPARHSATPAKLAKPSTRAKVRASGHRSRRRAGH